MIIFHIEPTLCWMNWNDPENSSFPQPAVQHLKEVDDNNITLVDYDDCDHDDDVSMDAKPCSCAIAEDIIKLLLAGGETGRRHIRVLQV